jgi:hypothetical protein
MTLSKKVAKAAKTVKTRAKKAADDLSAKIDELPDKLQKLGDKVETAFGAVSTEIDRVGRSVRGVRTGVVFEAQAETRPGERVVVAGNMPELGDFRPENALALDGKAYPLWKAKAGLTPGARVEYKYVRVNADGSFTWEDANENRALSVAAQGPMKVRDQIQWQ